MTDTPVPLAERIKALKRIMFVGLVRDDDLDAVQAILATLEQHDALAATLEDEQVAHQDTLRLWQEAKNAVVALREQHERTMAVVAAARHHRTVSEWDPTGLEALGARNLLDEAFAALDAAQETDRE